ncbi:hypothetical protein JCM5350_005311 [Sporobolomyces pararoseus]
MAPRPQRRAQGTVPVLTIEEQMEQYQQKLDTALNRKVAVVGERAIGEEIQKVSKRAEILAKQLLSVDPNVPDPVAVDQVNSSWINLIQTKQMQEVCNARDKLYRFQVSTFARFVKERDIEALLNLLGKACENFLEFAPSSSALAANSIALLVFRSQQKWVIYYYNAFAHPLECKESTFVIHPHAFLLSVSHTGIAFAGAIRLLLDFGKTLQGDPLKSLLQAGSLRIQHRISKRTKISILKVCAFYGTVIGLKQNRSAAHEMVLQGIEIGLEPSLSHRQRLYYFPHLSLSSPQSFTATTRL